MPDSKAKTTEGGTSIHATEARRRIGLALILEIGRFAFEI
jgi:hypothetical protein